MTLRILAVPPESQLSAYYIIVAWLRSGLSKGAIEFGYNIHKHLGFHWCALENSCLLRGAVALRSGQRHTRSSKAEWRQVAARVSMWSSLSRYHKDTRIIEFAAM